MSPASRRLRADRRDWEDLAALDPLWAVVSHPDRQGGGWDRDAFLATGEHDVSTALEFARSQYGLPERHGRALDFGCGAGRLSHALAGRFAHVLGLDVAEGMVLQARGLCADRDNVEFRANRGPRLDGVPDESIDLVLSLIALQHVSDPNDARAYVSELVRVLAPGGAAIFQLPAHVPRRIALAPRRLAYRAARGARIPARVLYERLGLWSMALTAVPEADVRATVAGAGGEVLAAIPDRRAGSDAITDRSYVVTRR